MNGKMLYFAYGSNLNLAKMKKRCPAAVPRFAAKLFEWRLAERVFADVEPFPGGCVHGAVYEVGEGEIEGLDHYEGFPEEYGKINVQVVDEQGKSWEAFLYVMTPRYRGECESYPYSNCYRSECSQGARDWGIPDAFAAEADPDR